MQNAEISERRRSAFCILHSAFDRGGLPLLVGIIAVANVDYPANQWWHYSQGLKDVVSESAAYLYARLFFFPSEPAHPGKAARLSPVHD